MLSQIDALFKLWTDNPGPGGQLLVTHKGKVIVDKCYGYANIETQTPITQDSVFHVASISKSITAMAIAILHDRGLLNVYDDVRNYVPEFIGFSEPLTIKQMMNHVSGMRCHYALMYLQGRNNDDCVLHSEMLRLIARQKKLNFAPGEEFMYSNPNYVLMATIVEKVTGQTFPNWVKENILEPLGMKDSFIRSDPRTIVPNRVSSYNFDGYRFRNALLNLTMYGSTGLNTTCRDLTRFFAHYQNPTLLSRETMESILFHVPEVKRGTTIYGGGLRFQEMLGHRYIHHGGVNAGFRTWGCLFPDDDLIVTIFTNVPSIPIETAGRDVARIVLGLPPRAKKDLEAYRAPAPQLDTLPGFYRCEANGDYFDLTMEDGKLYNDGILMTHRGDNIYQLGQLDYYMALGETITVKENSAIREYKKTEMTLPQELCRQLAGSYYNDEVQGLWHLLWEDGKFYWSHMRHGKQQLYWLKDETFFTGSRMLHVVRDDAGKIIGYNYQVGQIREMFFEKVK